MNSLYVSHDALSVLKSVIERYPRLQDIIKKIADQGGRALLVGGAVRDLLLGLAIKDLDIEVYGISLPLLEKLLSGFGPVSLVGKSFGVLKVHTLDVDWSVPRRDSSGRKPLVELDPHMSFHDAFARRDVTINAMGIDLVTYELIDPFGGQRDLERKVLRSPDITFFAQDQLRFYRVMQFMSRFEMQPDQQLQHLCATIDVSSVSLERIEQEFEKMLMRSKRPSLGLRWLHEIGRLDELLPELGATVGIEQGKRWHPEGDVFEHTMQTIDAAAQLAYESYEEKRMVMYAALCHDLGKKQATKEIEGRLVSWGHEKMGMDDARKLLHRLMRNNELMEAVLILVRHHMAPIQLVNDRAGSVAYKRLAKKIAPLSATTLAKLVQADKCGRNPDGHEPLMVKCKELDEFLAHMHKAGVAYMPEVPVLQGRDFLDVVAPGPELGELVKRAYELQIELDVQDKQELRKRVLAELKK